MRRTSSTSAIVQAGPSTRLRQHRKWQALIAGRDVCLNRPTDRLMSPQKGHGLIIGAPDIALTTAKALIEALSVTVLLDVPARI